MDENRVNNTNVISEEANNSIDLNNTTDELLASDDIALALDYNDRYYENVLSYLENIELHQETIIDNQEDIITKCVIFDKFFSVLIFLIVFIFIYNYIRNMITVK